MIGLRVLKESITSLTKEDLTAWMKERGETAFRSNQVLDWVWKKRVSSFDAMSNLSEPLREKLVEAFDARVLTHVETQGSKDTTRKILYKLRDGRYVESVLIPANPALYGERSDRMTLCVSSQVGCAFGCKFCASGLAGFTRNLTAGEITEQILQTEELTGEKINNLVFMGMGEPMANLDNLLKGVEVITSDWGLGIGARRLTISTSGVVPGIQRLADFPKQVRLAISLHGATNETRSKIMPVNKKWDVSELFKALNYWNEHKKQRITLEYILIKDVNDNLDEAKVLASRAKEINAKVNLIPYNTVEGLEWERPSETHCRRFEKELVNRGVFTTLRFEKGHDIDAACGQLRLKKETSDGLIEEAPMKIKSS